MNTFLAVLSVVATLINMFVKSKGQKAMDSQDKVSDALSKVRKNPRDTSDIADILK